MTERPGKLELIATKTVPANNDLYKIVDFLNKTLKDKNIMFGLTKNTQEETMTISVYET
ncbi:MAG: YpmA family protein [Firmicutes bacterium]|nr:YpmA family protein [Bacillota bacterium]